LTNNLSAEASSRVAGDASIAANLSTELVDRIAAVSTEAAARLSADNSIAANLSSEIVDRAAAVSTEVSNRIAGDDSIAANLSSEVSNREAAVSSEESRALAAELSLATNFANIYAKKVAVSGSIDGSNDTFTLASAVRANSEVIYLNGLLQIVGDDYTATTNGQGLVTGVEFIQAPGAGSKVNAYGVY
jgi:hypothetical protein